MDAKQHFAVLRWSSRIMRNRSISAYLFGSAHEKETKAMLCACCAGPCRARALDGQCYAMGVNQPRDDTADTVLYGCGSLPAFVLGSWGNTMRGAVTNKES